MPAPPLVAASVARSAAVPEIAEYETEADAASMVVTFAMDGVPVIVAAPL